MRPPVPSLELDGFDMLVSAVIDHLLLIQEHQSEIHEHQRGIDAALTILHTMVEEMMT
jgi:hypothetical protein